jgi:Transcriptional regulator PadR-like family
MAELVPGTLEMLILRTLTHGQMHGYGIAQRIHNLSEGVLRIEEGSLYPGEELLPNVRSSTELRAREDWPNEGVSIGAIVSR